MLATHTADVYGGKLLLCSIRQDPMNRNMVFGIVVRDTRGNLHTGSRVWIAGKQVTPRAA